MTTKQSFLYRVIAVDTIDADTHRVKFWLHEPKDPGFKIRSHGVSMTIDLRVLGIDLPEKHSEVAKERDACAAATRFAANKIQDWLHDGTLTMGAPRAPGVRHPERRRRCPPAAGGRWLERPSQRPVVLPSLPSGAGWRPHREGADADQRGASMTVDELLHEIYLAAGMDRPLYLRVEIEATRDGVRARAMQRCHDADDGTCDDVPHEMAAAEGQTLVGVLEDLRAKVAQWNA